MPATKIKVTDGTGADKWVYISRGQAGAQGIQGDPGPQGEDGADGADAYAIAVDAGFVGTRAQWLESLVGPEGDPGSPGADGADGAPGTDGAPGEPGPAGMSAFPPYMYPGALAVKTGTSRLYMDQAATISTIRASVGAAPAGVAVIVDIRKNGATIFTTPANRPTIAIGAHTATGVPDVTSLAPGDYLTADIVQVGSTATGADLTVQVVLA